MKIIHFLGFSGSGKTTAITSITKSMVRSGFRVGALKHIHVEGFTVDSKAKDTRRFAQSGASTVVSVSPKELAVIQRQDTSAIKLNEILRIFAKRGTDYLMIEGFNRLLAREKGVTHILCASDTQDAKKLLAQHPKPICISGKIVSRKTQGDRINGIPLMVFPRDAKKLLALMNHSRHKARSD